MHSGFAWDDVIQNCVWKDLMRFTDYYLTYLMDGLHSLGPLVITGKTVNC